jgi:uridylate kinase
MHYKFGKTVVIALGGSIVHPDAIDTKFLKDFKKFLAPFVRSRGGKGGTKFVLVVGGGKLARRFQEAAHDVSKLTDEDKDWIGIHATRLNGHLLRTIFRDVADPVMIDARHRVVAPKYPVTIAAGWRPGWSTDYVAMQLAADFGAGEAIIAGKPSHVYERDPAKKGAGKKRGVHGGRAAKKASPKKFDRISWGDYRKLIPRKWKPGLHAPVDPVGAALGERAGVRAIIVDGRNLKNFVALLNGNDFQGTIIG